MNADNPTIDLRATALSRWFDELADRGVIVTDEALVIREWNQWLVDHTGIAEAQAAGQPLFSICPTIASRGLDQLFHDALAGETRVMAQRLHKFLVPTIKGAIGSGAGEPAQSARIAPLMADNRVIGTIAIIEDVSERVASEHELRAQILVSERARLIAEDASKLKDEFLATLSHEIRTPLNAVLGWTRILRTQQSNAPSDRGLEVIERNAKSQLRLVEDLLDMARVISGKLRLEIAPVVLQDIIEAAVDVVEPAATAKEIAIRLSLDPARPAVNADPDRLQQALWNLLSNAVKFTPRGGHIDVTMVKGQNVVDVTVADDGQGIGREFLPYVFDRFRQADASPSRRHSGLGLGLALVRHIVELHGGRVSVKSGGTDKGASFLVRLPIADFVAEPARCESLKTTPISLGGLTIVLVEDSDDGREMLEIALRGYGAQVVAFESAELAVVTFEGGRLVADALISDIGMPGVDGYELIRRIRALPAPYGQIPAIAISAYANSEERLQALIAGYQAHLSKPTDPVLVADSIRQLTAAARASAPMSSGDTRRTSS